MASLGLGPALCAAALLVGAAASSASSEPERQITVTIGGDPVAGARAIVISSGEAFRATIRNATDRDVLIPAAPDACALIGVERREGDVWRKWSDCEFLRRVESPVVMKPGETIGHPWSRPRRSTAPAERSESPFSGSEAPKPPEDGPPVEREVQQLILDAPPVRFFERFLALPAGEYRLTTSFASREHPDEILWASSPAFIAAE